MRLTTSLYTETPFLRYWRCLSLALGYPVPLGQAWRAYASYRRGNQ